MGSDERHQACPGGRSVISQAWRGLAEREGRAGPWRLLGFRCYEGGGNIWGERTQQQTPGQRAAPDRTEHGIEMEALLGERGTALPSAGIGFLFHMSAGRASPRFPCRQKLCRPLPGIPLAVGELACWPVGDPMLLAPVCWAPAVPGPVRRTSHCYRVTSPFHRG